MKRLFFIFAVLLTFQTQAQIEVEKGSFPFEQIVEWPRKGTLLLGNDPTGRKSEKNFSLLSNEGEVQWNRSIYPKYEPTHIIVSGNSDYVYFVDNFEPVNNYIHYNQVNESGSIVPTKFNMLKVIRDYGYRVPGDLELRDIVNTPKSVVFYFQLPIKSKGIIENFFVTITHHNNKTYHCQGPTTDMDQKKSGDVGPFIFSGATSDAICFSRFENKEKASSFSYFSFTPKGKLRVGVTQQPKDLTPISSELNFVGLSGKYYLEKEKINDPINTAGRGLFIKGKYYYVANDAKERCLKIFGADENDEFVELNKCKHPAKEKRKYRNAKITFIPLADQFIVVSTIADQSWAYSIDNNKVKPVDIGTLNEANIRINPSSYRVQGHPNEFVHFIGDTPYFINPTTLEKTDKIIFKK